MKLREALIQTFDKYKITGKQLSEASGITEAQISRFKNGGELSLVNFEKVVTSLPGSAYHYFWCQLAVNRMDDEQLYQTIMMAATQLKEKQPSKVA